MQVATHGVQYIELVNLGPVCPPQGSLHHSCYGQRATCSTQERHSTGGEVSEAGRDKVVSKLQVLTALYLIVRIQRGCQVEVQQGYAS